MDLPHMHDEGGGVGDGGNDGAGGNEYPDIDLDEEIGDVGIIISRLGLRPSAMPAAEYIAIDDHEPTYAELGEDPLATEPTVDMATEVWAAPTTMQGVYDDSAPAALIIASPPINVDMTPLHAITPGVTPPAETPRRRDRVLPAWITQASRCQPLLDAGVTAVMRHSVR
ncbi:unnamed protein product [Closterium sp. NIES-64]|nr:unnamed protein product [Closterium sp. NIES-64]